MITLENVSKSFKDIQLFENLNVQFESGKKIFIKGINGSGKSVLLKLIVGYSTPDQGVIRVNDYQLGVDGDFIPNAGVSINAPEFMKNWTGLDNLLYLAKLRNIAKEEEILQLVARLGLTETIDKNYKTYSLGMKQKMRIIQALMDHPDYLILDEPFDALDKNSQKVVLELIEEYLEGNPERTLFFTSHNDAMEELADVIYEIDDKQLLHVSKNNDQLIKNQKN